MRRARARLAVAALLACGVLPAAGGAAPSVGAQQLEAELELQLSALLLARAAAQDFELPRWSKLTRVEELRALLPIPHVELLRDRDPWGNPLWIVTAPDLLLVSPGPDGRLDLPYDELDEQGYLRALQEGMVDDVLLDRDGIRTAARLAGAEATKPREPDPREVRRPGGGAP